MLLGFRGAKREPQKNMKTPPMTMLGHYETEKKAAGVVTTTAAATTTTKNKQKTNKNKKTNKQTNNNQQTTNCKDSGSFTSAANSRQISIYSLQFTQTFSRCGVLSQQSVGSHSQISTIMECAVGQCMHLNTSPWISLDQLDMIHNELKKRSPYSIQLIVLRQWYGPVSSLFKQYHFSSLKTLQLAAQCSLSLALSKLDSDATSIGQWAQNHIHSGLISVVIIISGGTVATRAVFIAPVGAVPSVPNCIW